MNKIKVGIDSGLEIPPVRALSDFLLGSARFQLPNFKDLEKWNNRVIQNLYYYQVNYYLTAVTIFLIFGFIYPGKMIMGMIAMGSAVVTFSYVTAKGRAMEQFKKKNPWTGVGLIFVGATFVTFFVGSLLIFLLGIFSPFPLIFIHASTRVRSLKNKVVNKFGAVGLKRTPMDWFFERFGMEMDVLE